MGSGCVSDALSIVYCTAIFEQEFVALLGVYGDVGEEWGELLAFPPGTCKKEIREAGGRVYGKVRRREIFEGRLRRVDGNVIALGKVRRRAVSGRKEAYLQETQGDRMLKRIAY